MSCLPLAAAPGGGGAGGGSNGADTAALLGAVSGGGASCAGFDHTGTRLSRASSTNGGSSEGACGGSGGAAAVAASDAASTAGRLRLAPLEPAGCESPPAKLLVSPRTLTALGTRGLSGQCVMLERRNSAANGT
jgi:hypothetical protein